MRELPPCTDSVNVETASCEDHVGTLFRILNFQGDIGIDQVSRIRCLYETYL